MIAALIPGENIDYIPKSERGSKNPTVFILKNLSIAEDTFMREMAMKNMQGKNQNQRALEGAKIVLHIGLVGAKNFTNRKGEEASFERDEKAVPVFKDLKPWTDETLGQIPRTIRDEIATQIIAGGDKMEDAERKNS